MIHDKAVYEKSIKDLSFEDKLKVKIPKEQFEYEARDINLLSMNDFYKSPHFLRSYEINDRYIQTLAKV